MPVGALLGVVAEPGVAGRRGGEIRRRLPGELQAGGEGRQRRARRRRRSRPADGTIRCLKAGPEEGTPILLIHGFGADCCGWMFNHGDLAADRPVHAIDLPGHGGSTKDVGDGTVAALADAVLAYMDAARDRARRISSAIRSAARSRVEIAARAPERATALTLIAPAGLGAEIAQDFIDGFIGESRARKLRPVIEMLVADPAPGHRRHGRGRAEVQTPRRRARRAARRSPTANFSGGTQKRLAARQARQRSASRCR